MITKPQIVLRGRVRVKPDSHEQELRLTIERDVREKQERFIKRRLRYRVNPVRNYLGNEPTLTCKDCGRRYLHEALQRQAERDTAAAFEKGIEEIQRVRCVCGSYEFN